MSSIQYYQTIIKNEAANCITQVAAFSFLTNYLINDSKNVSIYIEYIQG